jgi:hypothetical protein
MLTIGIVVVLPYPHLNFGLELFAVLAMAPFTWIRLYLGTIVRNVYHCYKLLFMFKQVKPLELLHNTFIVSSSALELPLFMIAGFFSRPQ